MKEQNLNQVPVDDDLNTLILLDREFPFSYYLDNLTTYRSGFVNWHKQTSIELSLVLRGGVAVSVPGEERSFYEGELFILQPGVLHTSRPAPDKAEAVYHTLMFAPEFLYGFAGSFFDEAYVRPLRESEAAYFFLSGKKARELGCPAAVGRIAALSKEEENRLTLMQVLQWLWTRMFPSLESGGNASKSLQSGKLTRMLDFLHAHFDEPFSLDALSGYCHQSKGECCRYFKKTMQMTLSQYLTEYRIKKALRLLDETTLSVTEIGSRTGFPDTSYFIKTFRTRVGVTPRQYRTAAQRET